MDAFDAQVEFSRLLRRVTASARTWSAPGRFLRDNTDLSADLWRQLVDEITVRAPSPAHRLNLLGFVVHLAGAQSSRLEKLIPLISRDLEGLCAATIPRHPHALANVAPVLIMLDTLSTGGKITTEVVNRALTAVRKREAEVLSSTGDKAARDPAIRGLSRSEILRRMDDDRERWKRDRDRLTAVDPAEDEFRQCWETLPPIRKNDPRLRELNKLVAESLFGGSSTGLPVHARPHGSKTAQQERSQDITRKSTRHGSTFQRT